AAAPRFASAAPGGPLLRLAEEGPRPRGRRGARPLEVPGPLGEKVYLARDCKAVFILGRPNRYHPSAGHYRVVLSGAGEGGPFAGELTSPPDARQAREEAKGAAAFLGLPVLEPDTDLSRASGGRSGCSVVLRRPAPCRGNACGG